MSHIVEIERYFAGRARLFRVTNHIDERGTLVPLEFANMPFVPQRAFFVRDVRAGQSRGGHAHSRGQQLLIRVSGEVIVDIAYQDAQQRIFLTDSTQALLIGPDVWASQTYSNPDATLLAFASEPYSESTYIRESR